MAVASVDIANRNGVIQAGFHSVSDKQPLIDDTTRSAPDPAALAMKRRRSDLRCRLFG